MKRSLVPLILFFLVSSNLSATEYYVDSRAGSDSLDGKTPQTAWQTLQAVNRAELQPGDTLRFKRGGQWRGQLLPKSGELDKPVTYTSYGNDNEKPSLLGSVPLNKESDWIDEKNGLWSTRSNDIDADVGNIILDGEKAAFKKWTLSDLKNEDDFWYDLKTKRVYYRSSEHPAKRFRSVEAALYRHVVNHSNCSHVIFDDLDIRYGAAHGFGGTNAKHCVYRNLDISWIGGADQYNGGGEGRRVRFGNGIEFWSDASDCLVEKCRLWEIYDAALTNQGSGVNVERNITYRGNTIWNCEYSFEYWNRGPESITENVVFENNVCISAGYGWGHEQRPDKNGRHVMIYANTAKTTNLVIRDNIFCNAKNSLVRIDADFRDGMSMEGNTYWQAPGGELVMWLIHEKFKTGQWSEYQKKTGLDKTSKLEKPDLSRYPELPENLSLDFDLGNK